MNQDVSGQIDRKGWLTIGAIIVVAIVVVYALHVWRYF
jgi:hypothetical protein